MHSIQSVKYLNDYLLELTFENKEVRCADLSYLTERGGVFEPFKDVKFFKKVAVDETGYTICWPNNVDLCPDKLWEISTPVKKTA